MMVFQGHFVRAHGLLWWIFRLSLFVDDPRVSNSVELFVMAAIAHRAATSGAQDRPIRSISWMNDLLVICKEPA